MSQVVKAGEVDRVGVRLIATQLGTGVFRMWRLSPTLMTNVGDILGPSFEAWLPHCLHEGASLEEIRERYEAKQQELDEMFRKGKN